MRRGTEKMPDIPYLLGHSTYEIRRLIDQAEILSPITERLLRCAGIAPGMRVLDVGCGAGDVALLAGELVGPSGSVVGIDRNSQVLAVARDRARTAGLHHLCFVEASVDAFHEPVPFDLVVGRHVLAYQADPPSFLRAAARFAAPGGVIALHEFLPDAHSSRHVALWEEMVNRVRAVFRANTPSLDASSRLIEHFTAAGLAKPRLFSETPIGAGVDAPPYARLAGLVETFLPKMTELGFASAESIEIATLEDRLRRSAVEGNGWVELPQQICAWTEVETNRQPERTLI